MMEIEYKHHYNLDVEYDSFYTREYHYITIDIAIERIKKAMNNHNFFTAKIYDRENDDLLFVITKDDE